MNIIKRAWLHLLGYRGYRDLEYEQAWYRVLAECRTQMGGITKKDQAK